MPTATYVLRSDRSKKIQVITPVFAIATIVGSDGKKTEMPRAEFDQKYEPELKAANAQKLGGPSNNGGDLSQLSAQLDALHRRLDTIGEKVEQIHQVAIPQTNSVRDADDDNGDQGGGQQQSGRTQGGRQQGGGRQGGAGGGTSEA